MLVLYNLKVFQIHCNLCQQHILELCSIQPIQLYLVALIGMLEALEYSMKLNLKLEHM